MRVYPLPTDRIFIQTSNFSSFFASASSTPLLPFTQYSTTGFYVLDPTQTESDPYVLPRPGIGTTGSMLAISYPGYPPALNDVGLGILMDKSTSVGQFAYVSPVWGDIVIAEQSSDKPKVFGFNTVDGDFNVYTCKSTDGLTAWSKKTAMKLSTTVDQYYPIVYLNGLGGGYPVYGKYVSPTSVVSYRTAYTSSPTAASSWGFGFTFPLPTVVSAKQSAIMGYTSGGVFYMLRGEAGGVSVWTCATPDGTGLWTLVVQLSLGNGLDDCILPNKRPITLNYGTCAGYPATVVRSGLSVIFLRSTSTGITTSWVSQTVATVSYGGDAVLENRDPTIGPPIIAYSDYSSLSDSTTDIYIMASTNGCSFI